MSSSDDSGDDNAKKDKEINRDLNKTFILKQVDVYIKRIDQYCYKNSNIHFSIYYQCTDALTARFEAMNYFEDINTKFCVICLLQATRKVLFKYKS